MHDGLADFPLARTGPSSTCRSRRRRAPAASSRSPSTPRPARAATSASTSAPTARSSPSSRPTRSSRSSAPTGGFWQLLPDTDDRYVNVSDMDEGIGVLSSLLLKKDNYRSMVGGDGACMGCGEKTVMHLVVVDHQRADAAAGAASTSSALDALIAGLDRKARDAARLRRRAHRRRRRPGSGRMSRSRREARRRVERISQDDRGAEGPALALPGGAGRQGPRAHWDRQRDRLLLGLGQHLSVQSVSVPLGEPPLPGCALDRHRAVRGAHAEDGRQLRRGPARGTAGAGRIRCRGARGRLRPLRLAPVHRRGVRPVPAHPHRGRGRRHARHRVPEPLPPAGIGQADPGGRARHPGVFQHRRAGLHQRVHRPGKRHGGVRQGAARQDGNAEGARRCWRWPTATSSCCSRPRRPPPIC